MNKKGKIKRRNEGNPKKKGREKDINGAVKEQEKRGWNVEGGKERR